MAASLADREVYDSSWRGGPKAGVFEGRPAR